MYSYQANISAFHFQKKQSPELRKQTETNIQFIEDLERSLRVRNYSTKTIKNYKNAVLRYLKYKDAKYYGQINVNSAQGFIFSFVGHSASNINGIRCALEYFFKNIIDSSIQLRLPKSKVGKQLPQILSKPQIESLIKNAKNIKYRTIFSFGYGLGLRVSEVINLKYSDINRTTKTIHLKQAKGKKDRIIPISEKLLKLLTDYSISQNHNSNFAKDYVFQNNNGEKLSEETINKYLREAKIKANIKIRCTFHCLRHAFATHLYEDSRDIFLVNQMLGLEYILKTAKYISCGIIDVQSPFDQL